MKDFDTLTEIEKSDAIDIFTKRQSLKQKLGGCPPEDKRINGHTNCFYCDECWIAALKGR